MYTFYILQFYAVHIVLWAPVKKIALDCNLWKNSLSLTVQESE